MSGGRGRQGVGAASENVRRGRGQRGGGKEMGAQRRGKREEGKERGGLGERRGKREEGEEREKGRKRRGREQAERGGGGEEKSGKWLRWLTASGPGVASVMNAVHPVWEVNEKGEWSIKGGGRWLVPVVDLGEGNG